MNLGTAITLLVVGVIVAFAVRSIVRDFRSGSAQCSECGTPCGKRAGVTCALADKMVADMEDLSLPQK